MLTMPSKITLAKMLYEQYVKYKGGKAWQELARVEQLEWALIADTYNDRFLKSIEKFK